MAEVIIDVVHFRSPNATGVQYVQAPEKFRRRTPKAVLIFGGNIASAGNDALNVETTFSRYLTGFAVNGGNTSYHAALSDSAVNATQTLREWFSGVTISDAISGNGQQRGTVNLWLQNGLRINWTTVEASWSKTYMAVFIGGDDVQAYHDVIDLGTGTSAQDITAPGFQPDLVLFSGVNTVAGSTSTPVDNAYWGFGAATPTKNRFMLWGEQDNIASGGQPFTYKSTAYAWGHCPINTGALAAGVVCDNFDSSGFDVTCSASMLNIRVGYLALDLGGIDVDLFDFATATATGNQAYTGVGFEPSFVLGVGSNLAAADTTTFNVDGGSNISIFAFNELRQYAYGNRSNSTSDPTSTGKMMSEAALICGTNTACDTTRADFVSFDADGFTLDYTSVSGNAQQCFAICFGQVDLPADYSSLKAIHRIINDTTPASAGVKNFTHPDFAGITPKAALLVSVLAANQDTPETTNARMLIGAADDQGNQGAAAWSNADNTTEVSAGILTSATHIFAFGSDVGQATMIDGGVSIDFSTLSTFTNRRIQLHLFGGDAVQARVGNFTPAAFGQTFDSLLFEPDVVLFGHARVNSVFMRGCFGAFTATAQRAFAWGAPNINANIQQGVWVSDTAALLGMSSSNDSLTFSSVGSFIPAGFALTTTGSIGGTAFYLALDLGGSDVSLFDFATPTSTGMVNYTDPGFYAAGGLIVATTVLAKNTGTVDVAAADGISIGGFDTDDSGVSATRYDNTQDPSDAGSVTIHGVPLTISKATSMISAQAALQSQNVDGFTLNYTTVNGAANVCFALVIEGDVPPTPPPSSSTTTGLIFVVM